MNSVASLPPVPEVPARRRAIRFPARSFLAFALAPEAPFDEWLEALDGWTQNSPGFFTGRPVVLDLKSIEATAGDAAMLVNQLAERAIRVYAIESDSFDGLGSHLPPVLKGARSAAIDLDEPEAEPKHLAGETTLVLDQPVRSGQSVYHPEGDVVVLGSVASGAEILAGGSIHVYGALRGRAFAGATGNDKARIFCRRNEAELMAIDGWYRTAEDMESSTWQKPVQASLDNGVVWVTTLNQ